MAVTLTFTPAGAHSDPVWERIALGAGGYIIDIGVTGTGAGHYQYCRGDVGGVYKRNGLGNQWRNVVKVNTLPNDRLLYHPYEHPTGIPTPRRTGPGYGSSPKIPQPNTPYGEYGAYELRHAPSDPTRAYMVWQNIVLVSNDSMETWQKTAFQTPVWWAQANGDDCRIFSHRMAVDPINKNVVYFGAHYEGLLYTTDGFATAPIVETEVPLPSQATITADPNRQAHTGIQICFDPNTGVPMGGRTRRIWAFSHGSLPYRSDDAGANWAPIAGGPTTGAIHVVCASNGDLYLSDYGVWSNDPYRLFRKSWRWNNTTSTWIELTPVMYDEKWHSFCVHPTNPAVVTAWSDGGAFQQSIDSGATWTYRFGYNVPLTSPDIPWIAEAFTNEAGFNVGYTAVGHVVLDAGDPTKHIMAMGIGVLVTTIPIPLVTTPTATTPQISESTFIETLCINDSDSTPDGKLIFGVQDRGSFTFPTPNPNVFQDRYAGIDNVPDHGITHGWSVDTPVTNPTGMYAAIVDFYGNGSEHSGWGLIADNSTWNDFPNFKASEFLGGLVCAGNIATGSETNFVVVPGMTARSPFYTNDKGLTWNYCTFAGLTTADNPGFMQAAGSSRKTLQSDKVNPNTFYVWHSVHGLYRSTDGGANFTKRIDKAAQGVLEGGNLAYMRAVPGNTGKLVWSPGLFRNYADTCYILDAVAGTATPIVGIYGIYAFGFGAPAPGQTMPSVLMLGSTSVADVYGSRGIYVTDDWFQTYRKLSNIIIDNHIDQITTITGNRAVYGKVYVGFGSSGGYYGTFT